MPKSKPLDTRSQIDMFPAKRGRGRPRKPDALSNAERQRRYRQKTVTVRASVLEAALAASQIDNYAYDPMSTLEAECDALRAKVTEQGVEIERLRSMLKRAMTSAGNLARNVTKKGT